MRFTLASRHRFHFRLISIVLVCLFTWNNITWANPDIGNRQNPAQKDTLQVQSIFKSMTDNLMRKRYLQLNSSLAFVGERVLEGISLNEARDVWFDRFIGDTTLIQPERATAGAIEDTKFLRNLQQGLKSAEKIDDNNVKIAYELNGRPFTFNYSRDYSRDVVGSNRTVPQFTQDSVPPEAPGPAGAAGEADGRWQMADGSEAQAGAVDLKGDRGAASLVRRAASSFSYLAPALILTVPYLAQLASWALPNAYFASAVGISSLLSCLAAYYFHTHFRETPGRGRVVSFLQLTRTVLTVTAVLIVTYSVILHKVRMQAWREFIDTQVKDGRVTATGLFKAVSRHAYLEINNYHPNAFNPRTKRINIRNPVLFYGEAVHEAAHAYIDMSPDNEKQDLDEMGTPERQKDIAELALGVNPGLSAEALRAEVREVTEELVAIFAENVAAKANNLNFGVRGGDIAAADAERELAQFIHTFSSAGMYFYPPDKDGEKVPPEKIEVNMPQGLKGWAIEKILPQISVPFSKSRTAAGVYRDLYPSDAADGRAGAVSGTRDEGRGTGDEGAETAKSEKMQRRPSQVPADIGLTATRTVPKAFFRRAVKYPKTAIAISVLITILGGVSLGLFLNGVSVEDIEYYMIIPGQVRDLMTDPSRAIDVTETRQVGENAVLIPISGGYRVAPSSAPLYTYGARSCAVLVIDDPVHNRHLLAHLNVADSVEDIEKIITDNFKDLNGLIIYILQGNSPKGERNIYNPVSEMTVKLIYAALKNLKLQKQVKFIRKNTNPRWGSRMGSHDHELFLPEVGINWSERTDSNVKWEWKEASGAGAVDPEDMQRASSQVPADIGLTATRTVPKDAAGALGSEDLMRAGREDLAAGKYWVGNELIRFGHALRSIESEIGRPVFEGELKWKEASRILRRAKEESYSERERRLFARQIRECMRMLEEGRNAAEIITVLRDNYHKIFHYHSLIDAASHRIEDFVTGAHHAEISELLTEIEFPKFFAFDIDLTLTRSDVDNFNRLVELLNEDEASFVGIVTHRPAVFDSEEEMRINMSTIYESIFKRQLEREGIRTEALDFFIGLVMTQRPKNEWRVDINKLSSMNFYWYARTKDAGGRIREYLIPTESSYATTNKLAGMSALAEHFTDKFSGDDGLGREEAGRLARNFLHRSILILADDDAEHAHLPVAGMPTAGDHERLLRKYGPFASESGLSRLFAVARVIIDTSAREPEQPEDAVFKFELDVLKGLKAVVNDPRYGVHTVVPPLIKAHRFVDNGAGTAGAVDAGSGPYEPAMDIMEVDQRIRMLFEPVRDSCLRGIETSAIEGLAAIKRLIPALEREVEGVSMTVPYGGSFAKKAASVLANISSIVMFFDNHADSIAALSAEAREPLKEMVDSIRPLREKLDSIKGMEIEKYPCSEELSVILKDAGEEREEEIIKEWLAKRMQDFSIDYGLGITCFFNRSGPRRKRVIISVFMDLAVENGLGSPGGWDYLERYCAYHYDHVDMVRNLHLSKDLPQSVEMKADIWVDKIRNDRYSEQAMAECSPVERKRRELEVYLLSSIIVSEHGLYHDHPGVIDMLVARDSAEEPFMKRLDIVQAYARQLYEKMLDASGSREREAMFDLGRLKVRVRSRGGEKRAHTLEGKLELHRYPGGYHKIFLNVDGKGGEYVELGHLVLELPGDGQKGANYHLHISDRIKGYGWGIRGQGVGGRVFKWMIDKLKDEVSSINFILPTEELLASAESNLKKTAGVTLEACLEADTWRRGLKAAEISALLKDGADVRVRLKFDQSGDRQQPSGPARDTAGPADLPDLPGSALSAALPDIVKEYLEGTRAAEEGWYSRALELPPDEIDPFFRRIAELEGGTAIFGGGSDITFILLGMPKVNFFRGIAEVNLIKSRSDVMEKGVFFVEHEEETRVLPWRERRQEAVLNTIYLNAESSKDLARFVENAERGRHLIVGNPTINVPLKHTAIAVVTADPDRPVTLFFRTAQDFADHERRILTLPDVEHCPADWGLSNRSDLTYILQYAAVLATIGREKGWRFEEGGPSLAKIRELVRGLDAEGEREFIAECHDRIGSLFLSLPDKEKLYRVLEEVLGEFGVEPEPGVSQDTAGALDGAGRFRQNLDACLAGAPAADADAILLDSIADATGKNDRLLRILGFTLAQRREIAGRKFNAVRELPDVKGIGEKTLEKAKDKILLGRAIHARHGKQFTDFMDLVMSIGKRSSKKDVREKIREKFSGHEALLKDREFLEKVSTYLENDPDILLSLTYILLTEIRAGPKEEVSACIDTLLKLAKVRKGLVLPYIPYYKLVAIKYLGMLDEKRAIPPIMVSLADYPAKDAFHKTAFEALVNLAREGNLRNFYAFIAPETGAALARLAVEAVARARNVKERDSAREFLERARQHPAAREPAGRYLSAKGEAGTSDAAGAVEDNGKMDEDMRRRVVGAYVHLKGNMGRITEEQLRKMEAYLMQNKEKLGGDAYEEELMGVVIEIWAELVARSPKSEGIDNKKLRMIVDHIFIPIRLLDEEVRRGDISLLSKYLRAALQSDIGTLSEIRDEVADLRTDVLPEELKKEMLKERQELLMLRMGNSKVEIISQIDAVIDDLKGRPSAGAVDTAGSAEEEFASLEDFAGRFKMCSRRSIPAQVPGEGIAVSEMIKREARSAVKAVRAMQNIRRCMDEDGYGEAPLIVWQNLTLGGLYPYFTEELKHAMGVVEITERDMNKILASRSHELDDISRARYILFRYRLTSQEDAEDEIRRGVDYMREVSRRIGGPVLVIDHSYIRRSRAHTFVENMEIAEQRRTAIGEEFSDWYERRYLSQGLLFITFNANAEADSQERISYFDDLYRWDPAEGRLKWRYAGGDEEVIIGGEKRRPSEMLLELYAQRTKQALIENGLIGDGAFKEDEGGSAGAVKKSQSKKERKHRKTEKRKEAGRRKEAAAAEGTKFYFTSAAVLAAAYCVFQFLAFIERITGGNMFINIFIAAGLLPPIEELFFRKFLMGRALIRHYKISVVKSIFISSLLFALVHIGPDRGFGYIPYTQFLAGIMLASLYARTRKILYPIAVHSIFNSALAIIGAVNLYWLNWPYQVTHYIHLAVVALLAFLTFPRQKHREEFKGSVTKPKGTPPDKGAAGPADKAGALSFDDLKTVYDETVAEAVRLINSKTIFRDDRGRERSFSTADDEILKAWRNGYADIIAVRDERSDQVIAYAAMGPVEKDYVLDSIAVLPEYRDKDIGTALVLQALLKAKEQGRRTLYIGCLKDKLKFYKKINALLRKRLGWGIVSRNGKRQPVPGITQIGFAYNLARIDEAKLRALYIETRDRAGREAAAETSQAAAGAVFDAARSTYEEVVRAARAFIQENRDVFLKEKLLPNCEGHAFEVMRRLARLGIDAEMRYWKKKGIYHVWVVAKDGAIIDAYPHDGKEPKIFMPGDEAGDEYTGDKLDFGWAVRAMGRWNSVANLRDGVDSHPAQPVSGIVERGTSFGRRTLPQSTQDSVISEDTGSAGAVGPSGEQARKAAEIYRLLREFVKNEAEELPNDEVLKRIYDVAGRAGDPDLVNALRSVLRFCSLESYDENHSEEESGKVFLEFWNASHWLRNYFLKYNLYFLYEYGQEDELVYFGTLDSFIPVNSHGLRRVVFVNITDRFVLDTEAPAWTGGMAVEGEDDVYVHFGSLVGRETIAEAMNIAIHEARHKFDESALTPLFPEWDEYISAVEYTAELDTLAKSKDKRNTKKILVETFTSLARPASGKLACHVIAYGDVVGDTVYRAVADVYGTSEEAIDRFENMLNSRTEEISDELQAAVRFHAARALGNFYRMHVGQPDPGYPDITILPIEKVAQPRDGVDPHPAQPVSGIVERGTSFGRRTLPQSTQDSVISEDTGSAGAVAERDGRWQMADGRGAMTGIGPLVTEAFARLSKADWHFRTATIKLQDGRVLAAKFLKKGEDPAILEYEAGIMTELRGRGIDVPAPLKSNDGSYIFTHEGALKNAPAKLDGSQTFILYVAPAEYFTYPEDIKDKALMLRLARNSMRQYAEMLKKGFVHTSLSPLTHETKLKRAWVWTYTPIGGIERLTRNVSYSNIRLHGIADFAHVKRIEPSDRLHYYIGQALSEWIVTITYHSCENYIDVKHIVSILKEGLRECMRSLGADPGLADNKEYGDTITRFVRRFTNEYLTDNLSSKKDGGRPTVNELVWIVEKTLKNIENTPAYKKAERNTIGIRYLAKGFLDSPRAMLEKDGKIYVADYYEKRLVEFDIRRGKAKYIEKTLAEKRKVEGLSPGLWPELEKGSRVYVADGDKRCLVEFDIETYEKRRIGKGSIRVPRAMLEIDGRIYVADVVKRCLVEFDIEKGKVRYIGKGSMRDALAMLEIDGRIYVLDHDKGCLVEFDIEKEKVKYIGIDVLQMPRAMLEKDGRIYVADADQGYLVEFDIRRGKTKYIGMGALQMPEAMIEKDGKIYVADAGKECLVEVDITGSSAGAVTSEKDLPASRPVSVSGDVSGDGVDSHPAQPVSGIVERGTSFGRRTLPQSTQDSVISEDPGRAGAIAQQDIISRDTAFLADWINNNKEEVLVRIPVEALEMLPADVGACRVFGLMCKSDNVYFELYYASDYTNTKTAGAVIYDKYGIPAGHRRGDFDNKGFRTSKQNTLTLAMDMPDKELSQQTLRTRLGGVNPKSTIILPVQLEFLPKNIFTGFKLIELSRFYHMADVVDEVLAGSIIADIKEMSPVPSKVSLTKEHILLLINGKTQIDLPDGRGRITYIGVLKMLFELLPMKPQDIQRLRDMYERAELALLAA